MAISKIPVTYIGKQDPYEDKIYSSGLVFEPGQTQIC